MDITQQQYMIALKEAGSLTGAAKILGISQPALSNWLNKLEAQLGIPLVIRSNRSFMLTPAGKIYFEGSRKMVEIRDKTYHDIFLASGTKKELIRLTGTPNGGAELFSRIFTGFKNTYPNVSLQFIESYNRQSLQMILDGKADLAFCSTLNLEPDKFEYIHSRDSELVLMLPSYFPMGYDASHVKRDDPLPVISLDRVQDQPFIMPGPDMSYYDGLIHFFERIGFHPNMIFQSANTRFIYEMIRGGNGMGILPRRHFSPLDRVSLYSLEPRLLSHAVIVYRKGRSLTPAMHYIIEYFVERFKGSD